MSLALRNPLRHLAAAGLSIACCAIFAVEAGAATKWYAVGPGSPSSNSKLDEINPTNGQATTTRALDHLIDGFAQDPVSGTWFATTDSADATLASHLVTITLNDGIAHDIGALGNEVSDIAFDNDGTLYGWGTTLYTINTSTGAATAKGGSSSFVGQQTIALRGDGLLFGLVSGDAGTLDSFNKSTGIRTSGPALVGLTGPNWGFDAADFDCDDNAIFGIDTDTAAHQLKNINQTTGVIASIGATDEYWALAAACNPTLSMAASSLSVNEKDGVAKILVKRTTGLKGPASAPITVTSASAISGADFTAPTGFISFAGGQSTAEIDVPIADDAGLESPETFTIGLGIVGTGTGGLLGSPSQTTVTIADDESEPRAPVIAAKQVKPVSLKKLSKLSYDVGCGRTACNVTASLVLKMPGGGSPIKLAKKASIAFNSTTRLTFGLSKSQRRRLKGAAANHMKVKAKLNLKATSAGGSATKKLGARLR